MADVSRELCRRLQSSTHDDYAKLKQDTRYLKATEVYRLSIRPEATTITDVAFGVTIGVDSGRAGCSTMRKSTLRARSSWRASRLTITRGHRLRWHSSGGAELYAMSSWTTETMGELQFLRQCDAKTQDYATMATGVSRVAKRIQRWSVYSQDLVTAGVVR